MVWGNLGDAYYWAPGKRADAARAYRKAIALGQARLEVNARQGVTLGHLARYHAMLGERKSALADLQRALEVAPDDPEVRFCAAEVYNQFGETDRTLSWLEKAVAVGYSPATIRHTPDFDLLRASPRFQALFRPK